MTEPSPEFAALRALHVRTGEPAFNARVFAWLAEHSIESIACDDPFQAVVRLTNHPETIPDFVFVGLDWLTTDELRLLDFLHESWPAATLISYAHEIHPGTRTPTLAVTECHGAVELARVLSEPPATLARGADDGQSLASATAAPSPRIAAPTPRVPPPIARIADLPPPRSVPTAEPTDNPPVSQQSLPRVVTRPADLLTREELAALLNQDFR